MGGFSCSLEILTWYLVGFIIVSRAGEMLFSLHWQSSRYGILIKLLVGGKLKNNLKRNYDENNIKN